MTEPLDLVALEKIRKEAVAVAAFWVSFADAVKAIGDMARAEAVAVVGSHRVPSATAGWWVPRGCLGRPRRPPTAGRSASCRTPRTSGSGW
jgi:hypothetical protein